MIMRLFHVRCTDGSAATLLEKFSNTSADVVQGEPGNQGYLFGQAVGTSDEIVIFASFWADLAAIQKRFGTTWRDSFLPEGYETFIEHCWLEHIDLDRGWHVAPEPVT